MSVAHLQRIRKIGDFATEMCGLVRSQLLLDHIVLTARE